MAMRSSVGLLVLLMGAPLAASLLTAAETDTDIVLTKDSLTVNRGAFVCSDERLKSVSQYVLAGTFYSDAYVSPKFPGGGVLQVNGMTPVAPRLSPEATMIFRGGFLTLGGEKSNAVEQVKQVQFLSGMSEIRLENGAENASTVLKAMEPNGSLLRKPGATVMLAVDEKRGAKGCHSALGSAEQLFVGGMSGYLKGAGGPVGSTTRSIIPWMTVGTYLRPGVGGFGSYDEAKGVTCLAPNEYDRKIVGAPDRNVWVTDVCLGPNKTQTVNAVVFEPYYGMEIGAGSTLTIASGCLQFAGRGPTAIGFHPHKKDWQTLAGTIDFGDAEGIIWSCFDAPFGPNIVGCVLAGRGGLTIAGSNTLILINTNTYAGTTYVCDGTLQLGDVIPNKARLGTGDVDVAAGASLRIMPKVDDGIADTATVTLHNHGTSFYGTMDLGEGVNEKVGALCLEGKAQPKGTYGGPESTAEHKLGPYFTGSGVLTVVGQ